MFFLWLREALLQKRSCVKIHEIPDTSLCQCLQCGFSTPFVIERRSFVPSYTADIRNAHTAWQYHVFGYCKKLARWRVADLALEWQVPVPLGIAPCSHLIFLEGYDFASEFLHSGIVMAILRGTHAFVNCVFDDWLQQMYFLVHAHHTRAHNAPCPSTALLQTPMLTYYALAWSHLYHIQPLQWYHPWLSSRVND